jgi:hypothetical protein
MFDGSANGCMASSKLRFREHNKNKLALKLRLCKRKMTKFLFSLAYPKFFVQAIELTAKAANHAA